MDHYRPPYADLVRLEPSIRTALGRHAPWMPFCAELEVFFQKTQGERRHRRYKIIAWLALFVFNMFIPTDALLLPDIYPLTMYVRLGFFSPLLLLALAWLHHSSSRRYRDAILVFLTLTAATCILFFLQLSHHPNVEHYHNGLILVIMFGTIIVRLPFGRAVACATLILTGYILTLSQMNMAPELVTNAVAVITVATFISLAANYQMELDARRAYAQDLLQDLDALRLEQANADLLHLSRLDALTELANRRTLDAAFDRAWRDGIRHARPLSLIMIDIDAFKAYNDTYGHPAGDLCLQKFARLLMGSLYRGPDLAARYGGEEFVILLPDTTGPAALHVAERMLEGLIELAIPHTGNPAAPFVTFSAGVATLLPHEEFQPQRLLQAADEALYTAKQAGRNRIIVATIPPQTLV